MKNISDISLYAPKDELVRLLTEAYKAGFKVCMEMIPDAEKCFSKRYISERQAYKIFSPQQVKNWVADGDIVPKMNGNGRNSTKLYEYSRLMTLATSETIKIRKPYINNVF